MSMDLLHVLIISTAAFFAGIINALAGGGSFLTLPALVFAGVPPVMANATGTTALLLGYVSSAWSNRDLIHAPKGMSLAVVLILGLLGGAAGASLLLLTSNALFRSIVPWLLLFATMLFAFGPRIHAVLVDKGPQTGRGWGGVGIVGVCGYGGYFNGGMGIVILAMLRLMGVSDLNVANGLKNLLSAVLTLIAVIIYALGSAISWPETVPMAIFATLGGIVGARLGRVIPHALLRNLIIGAGAISTVLFFLRIP
jgi:uncharacterized protein